MRKVLTLLILLSLFVGMAGAANVTISKIPTFNWGPAQGMKNVGTIQAGDLYATDDLLVAGDAEVIGTLYVGILNAGANITSGHLTEDTTIDAGVDITAASGDGAFDYSLATGAFTTGAGTNTLSGNTVIAGSKTFGTGTGAVSINGATTFAANKGIAMTSGTGAMDFSLGTGVFKTTTGAVTIGPGLATVSGGLAYSVNASTTISTTLTSASTKTVYPMDGSGGHVTLTLPDPTTVSGRTYIIAVAADMGGNNIIVADTGAGKIGGAGGADTLTSTDATAALTVISDGTHYLVTNKVGVWT